MINLSNKYFLMIEPDKKGNPSSFPVNDELSKKVEYIFSYCKKSRCAYKGFHTTQCGKVSDNVDWILPNGMITNNLCNYYIQYYRDYIPQSEIKKINDVYSTIKE